MLILSLSFVLTISMRSFQFQQLLRKDERLRKIIEAVTHLKIIKLNVWEETFDSQVDELRAKELTSIRMFLTLQVKKIMGQNHLLLSNYLKANLSVKTGTEFFHIVPQIRKVTNRNILFILNSYQSFNTLRKTKIEKSRNVCFQKKQGLIYLL